MRNRCIVCGSILVKPPIYICKNMPEVSQNLPNNKNLNQDKTIDLNLCQCSGCGLVQFDCEPVKYYKDSTRAGERCEALISLRKKQYKHLIESYNLEHKKIIEIGAGKGGFLQTFKEMSEYDIREYGIENNDDFVKIAKKKGINVFKGYIDSENVKINDAPFDAFVSFAYLARLIDPNTVLQGIRNNLVDEGIGLVMVPSLEHLLKIGGFYDITRDHIAYYSKETLQFLMQRNGFDILEQGEISKIYIYAIVRKRKILNMKKIWSDSEILEKKIIDYVNGKIKNGKKIAVWCAGHFAFTILTRCDLGEKIEYIIDNAAFKQNCYSPGSHVKIVSPDYYQIDQVDIIMILGPIYIDEIVNEIHSKCSINVEIVTVDKGGLRLGL